MKFGPLPTAKAEGAILAHSLKLGVVHLRKGQLLVAADIAALKAAGIPEVIVAQLGADDIEENTAAGIMGAAAVGNHISASLPHAGRVNLIAEVAGVLQVEASKVDALNAIDPAITLATLSRYSRVAKGQLLATIKIIPYAVNQSAVAAASSQIAGALHLHPVQKTSVSLVMSEVDGFKPSLLEKGRHAVEARLARLGVALHEVKTVPHTVTDMAAAIAASEGELVLVLGAMATSDLSDIAPEAVRLAGGVIRRFGIPVDPGNLLFLGTQNGREVLGLPGCARALALNGADWVLERLICGIPVSAQDIMGMGVGGLLKEIPTRPQPRNPKPA